MLIRFVPSEVRVAVWTRESYSLGPIWQPAVCQFLCITMLQSAQRMDPATLQTYLPFHLVSSTRARRALVSEWQVTEASLRSASECDPRAMMRNFVL